MAEHPLKPFYSVLVLAFFCSAMVAGAVVGLKPLQDANRQLDRKKNILASAGLYRPDQPIDQLFSVIETRIIELATGEFVPKERLSPEGYDQLKAALAADTGRSLETDEDLARIRRLEKYSLVYLVKKGEKVEQYILPVRGKGLWSTMFAYVAVDADLNTIRGVAFYEHGETPGLGGVVENSRWQTLWQNKKIYTGTGDIGLRVVKGKAAASGEAAGHEIDGLSGATLTTQGVDHLLHFWFGDEGFKPFFRQLKEKETANG